MQLHGMDSLVSRVGPLLDGPDSTTAMRNLGSGRCQGLKGVVAHANMYLLEEGERRSVIVVSAKLSETAFPGRRTETPVVYDDDPTACEHFENRYQPVLARATTEVPVVDRMGAGGRSHQSSSPESSKTDFILASPQNSTQSPLTGRDPAAEGGGAPRLSPDPREPFNGAATLRPRKEG